MSVSPQQPQLSPQIAPEASDHSLLRRLRVGEQDAATQLYFRYAWQLDQLARSRCPADIASRLSAEDIVQSVFFSFFRGVNLGYYDVPAGETLWKLLLVIALNKIRTRCNFHRAARRDVCRTGGSALLDLTQLLDSSDDMPRTLLRLVIDETLERLPETHQQMIRLRIEGYEVAEIAVRSGRSRRTVERVLQEFRGLLAGILREDN